MFTQVLKAALIGLAFTAIVHADLQVTQKQTIQEDKKGKEPQSTTVVSWIGEKDMRSDDGDQTTLINLGKEMMYLIDHKKKNYQELSLQSLGEMSAAAGDDMSEAMKSLPPGMQDMFKMSVSVEPTTETKQIGKWQCTRYNQTIEMAAVKTESEIWATEDIKISQELLQKQYAAAYLSQPAMKEMLGKMMTEMKKIKGYMVMQRSVSKVMGTETVSTTELIDIKEANPPAGTYEIPPKYKKVKD